MMKHRVYDSRTNETLFSSDTSIACLDYILDNFDEEEDVPHIFIGTTEINDMKTKNHKE